ncbi:hypothetical protein BIT28_13080 [Photobacterium proteolyticum]|uniref:Uncharacterized protein n=1 Tax=Photobacterium proteolyticum TaxID=1903952 RepID=A0A1Q9GKD7_9GAMM|nr:hypothetical protein [Photobacterium proteolyticum]OLQ74888.1 hypothetical protein BIT28_13080 [Photobacterium proteolyticum]
MVDFIENMRLKGKAEEDLYFAELDRKLIEALHEKQARQLKPEEGPVGSKESPTDCSQIK